MAIGIIRNIGGGTVKSKFPWDSRTQGGWNGLNIGLIAGTDGYCTSSIYSPKIKDNCSLKFTLSTGTSSGSAYVQGSTDGANWSTISYQSGSSITGNIMLTNYVGSNILLRVRFINGDGQAHTMYINEMQIIQN